MPSKPAISFCRAACEAKGEKKCKVPEGVIPYIHVVPSLYIPFNSLFIDCKTTNDSGLFTSCTFTSHTISH